MPDQDGLRFLFDIQDKITAKLAKIEAKSKASVKKIDKTLTAASRAQETHSARLAAMEERRVAQGKILAQRLTAAQSREARQAANFRIAAARRTQMASEKAERKIAAASKARAREQKRASEGSIEMARKSVFALAALGAAFTAVSVKLVGLGSDAEETENVTGLAFGEMKGAAEEWAADFAKATGSSRFESVELVSDLGLVVKGMGFTEKASLGMSSRMVELAADMSSAKNVPLAEALDKIRAGLIGESEPLRTMGVLLSEARVKQEAYASGIAKTGTELTNQQKVQARMNIILADSAAMHGDLVNTQASVANQWRAIKNRVFDAATALGQKLLPVASDVLGVLGEWVTKGAELITWVTKSEERMDTFGAILAGVVVTGLGLAAAALWALVPAVTAATGGINLLIPLIATVVGALVAGWVKFGDTIKDFLRKVWAGLLDKIGSGLKTLSKFVGIFRKDWAKAMKKAGEGLEETADEIEKTAKVQKAATKVQKAATKEQVKATKVLTKATKEQKKATKEQTKAEKAAEKAAKAAKKEADAVQDLADSWTGATLRSDRFLKAYKKLTPAQRDNDRIMDQVIQKYGSMRKILGPFNDELEHQWRTTERLKEKLEAQEKAQKAATKAQEDAAKAAEALNGRLEGQRLRLLGLPTDEAVQDFNELKIVWEGLNEAEKAVATDRYAESLRIAAEAGHDLTEAQLDMVASIEELDTKVEQSTAAKNFTDQWNTAMGNLTASISKSITDIWSGEGSPLKKLGNAFLEFGKGALSAITATLLTPVLNAVTNLATSIGTKLFSSITGAVSSALSSALGGAAGGVAGAAGGVAGGVGGVAGGVGRAAGGIGGNVLGWAGLGVGIADAVIGGFQRAGMNKTLKLIEESTRWSKIDTHGIRHGLATAEYTLASSWPNHEQLGGINKTLSETLWPIRHDVRNTIPQKLDGMLKELQAINANTDGLKVGLQKMGVSGSSRLKELRAINSNTDGLKAAIRSAIKSRPKGLTAKDLSGAISAALKTQRRSDGVEGRQHGGPVSAGRRYLVGERGPEMFVPSRSGRIDPGSRGGGADAKDLARAVKDALNGVKVETDGRQLGRLVVRHQPLAVAELGGRR